MEDSNINANKVGANRITASWGLIEEVGVKAQVFQGFLPKSESINQLILYKSNFLFTLYAVISASVNVIGFFLNNTLYKDLAMVYFCCFYTYIPYFCR